MAAATGGGVRGTAGSGSSSPDPTRPQLGSGVARPQMAVVTTRLLDGAWAACVAVRWCRRSDSAAQWSPVVVQMMWHLDAMIDGDSKVKTLFRLPMLVMAMLSGAVHLLESVAIRAIVQLHIKSEKP
uniref:Uncharacterized protein n=1 Tax=Oryza punctata TaxID=4537 RepID=A0A0E0MFG0_ORYPU